MHLLTIWLHLVTVDQSVHLGHLVCICSTFKSGYKWQCVIGKNITFAFGIARYGSFLIIVLCWSHSALSLSKFVFFNLWFNLIKWIHILNKETTFTYCMRFLSIGSICHGYKWVHRAFSLSKFFIYLQGDHFHFLSVFWSVIAFVSSPSGRMEHTHGCSRQALGNVPTGKPQTMYNMVRWYWCVMWV